MTGIISTLTILTILYATSETCPYKEGARHPLLSAGRSKDAMAGDQASIPNYKEEAAHWG